MNKLYYILFTGAMMIFLVFRDKVKPQIKSEKFSVVLRVDGLNTIQHANSIKDTLGRRCEELDLIYAVAAGPEGALS